MRIAFDARMITHPGIGRYISCLLPEIIRQAPDMEIVLLGDPKALAAFSLYEHVRIVPWDIPIYSLWEQLSPARSRVKADVLHVPHFNIPLGYKGKLVSTIHDLIYLLFPDSVSNPMASMYARKMIKSALEKSERVITVSNYTKTDLLELFGGTYREKIDVIYEAPGSQFHQAEDRTREADVSTRYRLSENMILYVGSIKPHKNVASLLKVYNVLKKWGAPHQLVICGRWDKKEDKLRELIDEKNVRYLGEVSTEDLATLYNMADVLVHLSLYEGFGLTVLEAMSCGCPAVVSNRASLPEVAGKSAFLVDPENIDQAADTVFNVLMNKQLRQGMIDDGLEHVKKFSWKKAARETIEAYKKALG